MSEIKALEKLRAAGRNMAKGRNLENHEESNLLLVIADEIQAEIDERFMALPLDADGVPIRVGDKLFNKNKPTDVCKVSAIAGNGYIRICHDTAHIHSSQCRHVKPDPLKELLNDRINDVLLVMTSGIGIALETALNDSFGEECADEIRELMKEGGE